MWSRVGDSQREEELGREPVMLAHSTGFVHLTAVQSSQGTAMCWFPLWSNTGTAFTGLHTPQVTVTHAVNQIC